MHPHRSPLPRLAAAALVAASLITGACSASTPSSSPATAALDSPAAAGAAAAAATLRTITFDEAVTSLGAADVAVFEDVQSTDPIRAVDGAPALAYTRWQVEAMTAEVNNRNGMRGANLDEAIPMGEGAPPLSYLLAAWVKDAPTPSAKLIADLMGPHEWERAPEVVFPTMALTLFVADAAEAASGGATAAPSTAAGPSTTGVAAHRDRSPDGGRLHRTALAGGQQVGAVCGLVNNFVDNSLNWIVGKLTVDPGSGGIGGFLGTVWNTALQLAKGAVQTLITPFTEAVLAPIRAVLATIAIVTMVVSYLKPWQLPVKPKPGARQRYSIDGDPPNTGSFEVEAKIEVGTDVWPAELRTCAEGMGVKLPELTAAGAPVEWQIQRSKPDAIEVKGSGPPWRQKLDNSRKANLEFTTGHEPRDWADRGAPTTSSAWATAKVERKEVTEMTQLVDNVIASSLAKLGLLGGVAKAALQPFIDRLLATAKSKLPSLLHVEGYAMLVLDHHKAPDPTTTTGAPTTSAAPAASACNPDKPRFETGTWKATGTLSSYLSSGGEVKARTTTPGDLSFEVTIDKDGTVTKGSWTVTGMVVEATSDGRTDIATYLGQGPLTGTGAKLLMGGGFAISVAGTSMDVPADNYPIFPSACTDGRIRGDITPPADDARRAAGIEGGFEGPFTAEMVG